MHQGPEEPMKYLCLVFRDEAVWNALSGADYRQRVDDLLDYRDELRQDGHLLSADALQPARTVTALRVRDGAMTVTDGPFVETKEQLGGCYLIEASDLDQAIRVAAKIPSAPLATIEVRPLKELEARCPSRNHEFANAGPR